MSNMSNILTYSWSSEFGSYPFEIKVFAHNVADARKEVFAVLDEIARWKSEYQELETELGACLYEEDEESSKFLWGKADVENPRKRLTSLTFTELRARKAALVAKIPASFFQGCFAAGPFDYTVDAQLRHDSETLGDFINNTEPECLGPVRMVAFSSCIDG